MYFSHSWSESIQFDPKVDIQILDPPWDHGGEEVWECGENDGDVGCECGGCEGIQV